MKLVCLGDSFTRGYGVNPEGCWVGLLKERLPLEIINKGVNGDTTGGMLARFYNDVVLEKPKYVLIAGGFNDLLSNCDLGVIESNIMSMVHQAYHNNIIPIVMNEPKGNKNTFNFYWPGYIDIENVQNKLDEYGCWLKNFAEGFSVFSIDIHSVTENDMFRESSYRDGIHMTDKGHKMIADKISEELYKIIYAS